MANISSFVGFLWAMLCFGAGYLTKAIVDKMKDNEKVQYKKK